MVLLVQLWWVTRQCPRGLAWAIALWMCLWKSESIMDTFMSFPFLIFRDNSPWWYCWADYKPESHLDIWAFREDTQKNHRKWGCTPSCNLLCLVKCLCREKELLCTVENVNCYSHYGKQYEDPQKIKNGNTLWFNNPLGLYLKEMKLLSQKDTCTPMFIASLFTIAET